MALPFHALCSMGPGERGGGARGMGWGTACLLMQRALHAAARLPDVLDTIAMQLQTRTFKKSIQKL